MNIYNYFVYKRSYRMAASLPQRFTLRLRHLSRLLRPLESVSSKPFTELIEARSNRGRLLPRSRPPDPRLFFRNTSGTSAIEFAIVAPVFVLLIFGMIAYGIYFGAMHSVQQMAADAARTAIAGLDQTERKTLAQRYIDLNADGYIFIDRSKLVVNVQDSTQDSEQFVVSLRYDASQLPIWNLFPLLPLPEKTIARSSTIRVGGI